MSPLEHARRLHSPRFSPPASIPWRAVLIHGAVGVFFLLLIMRGTVAEGLLGWSIGITYIGYDTVLLLFVFFQTWPLRHAVPAPSPLPSTSSSGHAPAIGVIIAARNEAAVLPVTIEALLTQQDQPDLIVLADDGSTDTTKALMMERYGLAEPPLGVLGRGSATHPSLAWLRMPHRGKAAALNDALPAMDTEVVVTVDADTVLDRGAIGAIRRSFTADSQLVALTGVIEPVCAPTISGRVLQWFQTYEYVRNFLSRYAWGRADCLLLISGAFAGFRRQAILDVGGFDQDCLVEDYELIHRLRRFSTQQGLGWRTAVTGDARARTEAPGTLPAFLRQRRRWFGGFLQTQYWYRDMVGNPAYGALGLAMLPVKACDTMQPLFGLGAALLLIGYLFTGHTALAGAAFGVVFAKLLLDLSFHLWSVYLYRQWTHASTSPRGGAVHYAAALLAALAEPFSFQLLRHLGAALGWIAFLGIGRGWGVQRRTGAVQSE